MWYSENELYKYGDDFSYQTGHFTQMVWKKTRQVGFGLTIDPVRKEAIFMAYYYPAGNFEGKFMTNVLQKTTV